VALVSIVRHSSTGGSLRKALDLCEGLKGLKSNSRVLIKPNLVMGSERFQVLTKGTLTTATIMEELVILLQEYGCTDITIGEGSIVHEEVGINTATAFECAGMKDLADRRGVKLLDFYQEPFVKLELDGRRFEVAEAPLKADFLINVPVLKTHIQTKVSLGLKNTKGVLSMASKKNCHRHGLEDHIAVLANAVKPHLTILDGLYTVDYGPVNFQHKELGLLVAGKDPLAVDMVGSSLLGIAPDSVVHLVEYANMQGRSVDLSWVEVSGEKINEVGIKAAWDCAWLQDIVDSFGVKGLTAHTPGHSFCSGCIVSVNTMLRTFCSENPGATFDGVEVCVGREPRPSKDAKLVFLLGRCALESNPNVQDAIRVKGCPLSLNESYRLMKKHALPK